MKSSVFRASCGGSGFRPFVRSGSDRARSTTVATPTSRRCSPPERRPLFVCRQTGTSLEMIEKHYGDARVDAEQLDEMIGELEPPTRNLPGTLPVARDDSLPSKVKEPLVFYGVPRRAGDRGRTGDVQLGKLSWPLRGKAFSAAVAEMG